MPRVILAHWHAGLAPGDELDVTDEELTDLRRDGRISDVLDGPSAQPGSSGIPEAGDQAPEPVPEAEAAEPEAAADEPPLAGRKRR